MRGYAQEERRVGLDDTVENAWRIQWRVNHDLASGDQTNRKSDDSDVVAQRAERIDDGILIEAPVADHRPAVGENGIVGVHHAFGMASGARGVGQINNSVRVDGG